MRTPLHRIALGAVGISLALTMTVSCSSDKSDNADKTTQAGGDASGSTSAASDEFCQAARDSLNLTPDETSKGLEEQEKFAPDELAADYTKLVAFAKFSEENPSDQPAIKAKAQEVGPTVIKVADYLQRNCNIEIDFFGS